MPDDGAPNHEFNVIKYVNRQLYAETAGREVTLNTLHFSIQKQSKSSPAEHLLSFFSSLSPRKKGWIGNVVLHAYVRDPVNRRPRTLEDTPYTIGHIVRLSRKCPLLNIRYVIPNWKFNEEASAAAKTLFLCRSVIYAYILGHYDASAVFELGSHYYQNYGTP